VSESDFIFTLDLLFSPQVIVSNLFVGNFNNEVVQKFGDGVHRSSVFQLRFDLGQDGHDTSLGGEVHRISIKEGGGVSCGNQDD